MVLKVVFVLVAQFALISGNEDICDARNNRLIIAMDGTDNKPFNEGNNPTSNVVRIARGLKPQAQDGAGQIVRYNWGIGAEETNSIERGVADVTGDGMDDDIMNCYRFLVQNYVHGIDVYLIGFSRGAFSALSLAGMVEHVGIVPKRKLKGNMIGEAFDAYKDRLKNPQGLKDFRKRTETFNLTIKFMGLFDIVGALKYSKNQNKHIDYCPSSVDNAFHAVSIDEDREDFVVTLLDNEKNKCHNLTELWFPGAHSDIGGGYVERNLSNHVLKEMAKHMVDHGMEFYDDYGTDDDDVLKFHREVLPATNPREIPAKAKFNARVIDLLKNNAEYSTYCNPHLAKVDDLDIKQHSGQCKGRDESYARTTIQTIQERVGNGIQTVSKFCGDTFKAIKAKL